MIQQHQEWLEDLVIRLLCVFALDRFGDFVSDEVSITSGRLCPIIFQIKQNKFFENMSFLPFSFVGCGTSS